MFYTQAFGLWCRHNFAPKYSIQFDFTKCKRKWSGLSARLAHASLTHFNVFICVRIYKIHCKGTNIFSCFWCPTSSKQHVAVLESNMHRIDNTYTWAYSAHSLLTERENLWVQKTPPPPNSSAAYNGGDWAICCKLLGFTFGQPHNSQASDHQPVDMT